MNIYRRFLVFNIILLLSNSGKNIVSSNDDDDNDSTSSPEPTKQSGGPDGTSPTSPSGTDTATAISSNGPKKDSPKVVVDNTAVDNGCGCTCKNFWLGLITFGIYNCVKYCISKKNNTSADKTKKTNTSSNKSKPSETNPSTDGKITDETFKMWYPNHN